MLYFILILKLLSFEFGTSTMLHQSFILDTITYIIRSNQLTKN